MVFSSSEKIFYFWIGYVRFHGADVAKNIFLMEADFRKWLNCCPHGSGILLTIVIKWSLIGQKAFSIGHQVLV